MKLSVVFAIYMLLLMAVGRIEAQFSSSPLTLQQRAQIENEVATNTIDVIQAILLKEKSHYKIIKILEELGKKSDPESLRVLKGFNEILLGNEIETQMVRAAALTAIAKAEAGNNVSDIIKALEHMLSEGGQPFLVSVAAWELNKIGTKEAQNVLVKNEKGNPNVKIARLQLQYGGLNDKEFVSAILDSAQQALLASTNYLPVAEGSLLQWRGSQICPLLEKRLENARAGERDAKTELFNLWLQSCVNNLGSSPKQVGKKWTWK